MCSSSTSLKPSLALAASGLVVLASCQVGTPAGAQPQASARAAVPSAPAATAAPSVTVTAAPSVTVTTAPSGSTAKPVPSVIVGREACQACLAAVEAGQFLTPTGSSHYLAGCDISDLRQRCLDATRRALPTHVAELVRQHRCTDAKTLVEFAERGGTSSAALRAAARGCMER